MLQALKAAEEAEKEWEADSPLQKGDIGLTAGLVHELKAAHCVQAFTPQSS